MMQSVPPRQPSAFPATAQTKTAHCDRHGPYESMNYLGSRWTSCYHCGEETAAKESNLADHSRADRITEYLAASGIPDRFRDRTLDGYTVDPARQKQAAVLAFCRQYVERFDEVSKSGKGIIFHGTEGTGKTHLACAIGLSVLRRYALPVTFTSVQQAMRRIKATWDTNTQNRTESETFVIAAFSGVSLLILDEVGIQHGSATEQALLFGILNTRYDARRPTIFLSNFSLDQISRLLTPPIMGRIEEDGGRIFHMDWPSHRRQPVTLKPTGG